MLGWDATDHSEGDVLRRNEVDLDNALGFLIQGTDLTLFGYWVLCSISFLGSFLAATLGLGGGVLVLATMAQFLPPTVLVPIHGVVQLGSNLGRAILMVREAKWSIVPACLVGTLLGAAVGAQVVVTLPTRVLQVVLGVFILYATWAPRFQSSQPSRVKFFMVGAVSTLVTMFVGATGALVAPFVAAACAHRREMVSTHAVVMSIQHGFKVIAFGAIGFAFGPYISLLAGLLLFGFMGTYAGGIVLNRLPERLFRSGLRMILTLLSLRLLYSALAQSIGE